MREPAKRFLSPCRSKATQICKPAWGHLKWCTTKNTCPEQTLKTNQVLNNLQTSNDQAAVQKTYPHLPQLKIFPRQINEFKWIIHQPVRKLSPDLTASSFQHGARHLDQQWCPTRPEHPRQLLPCPAKPAVTSMMKDVMSNTATG